MPTGLGSYVQWDRKLDGRLAQALMQMRANAYPHGVCWVELASLADATLVPNAIGSALGIALGTGSEAVDTQATTLAA